MSGENYPAVRARMEIPWFESGKRKPSAFSASDLNRLVAPLRALVNPQVRAGTKNQAQLSDGNFVIEWDSTSATSGTGKAVRMRLKDVLGDYLVAVVWDGTNEGEQLAVAKPYELRESLLDETILGVVHNYTYASGPSEAWAAGTDTRYNRLRIDSALGGEVQRVIRPYVENEEISAIDCDTGLIDGDGNAITMIEIKPNRQWGGPAA